MTMIGRPSAIDQDRRRIRRLLRLVADGVPSRQAAVSVGIPAKTYDRWMREARTAERQAEEGLELSPNARRVQGFRVSVEQAVAGWEARMVGLVVELAVRTGSPAAILEMLRRHPDTRVRWNVPDRVELHEVTADAAELAELDDAELTRRIVRLQEIAMGPQTRSDGPEASEG